MALPFQVADGAFDIGRNVYNGVKQLGVHQKVSGLMKTKPFRNNSRARRKISDIWRKHKPQVYRTLDEVLHVEGDWKVVVDQDGTDFHYGEQKIGVDAHVKATATGTFCLLKKNLGIPFVFEGLEPTVIWGMFALINTATLWLAQSKTLKSIWENMYYSNWPMKCRAAIGSTNQSFQHCTTHSKGPIERNGVTSRWCPQNEYDR